MIDEIKESPPNWESPTPPTPLMYTPPGPDELLSSPRPDESPPSQRCPNCAHHHSAFERQSELLPGGAIKLTTDVLARMGGALSPARLLADILQRYDDVRGVQHVLLQRVVVRGAHPLGADGTERRT